MNKKTIFIFAFIFAIGVVAAAASRPSMCCEKIKNGAWCINSESENCNQGFKTSPTSCESTSYCRLGTCYNSAEGFCMENTPKRVCDEQKGMWDSKKPKEIPQCQLGCCVIADQAAFVSLVRCKRLAGLFGVAVDYRTDIQNEIACIATAQSQDMGACVFEQEFEKNCIFTTRKNCDVKQKIEVLNGSEIQITGEKKFYKNYLCSAEELNTICAKQTATECYQGKVYWQDSCGNRENVYSSDRDLSWNKGKILDADSICKANDGKDSSCGNCDYLLGTRCGKKSFGSGGFGDYSCKRTDCKDAKGNARKNGESWCVYDGKTENGIDSVGSRHYKEVCLDGEIHVEPCSDLRNEVCIQGSVKISTGGLFSVSACRPNRWEECTKMTKQKDCLNTDRRDCIWKATITGMAEELEGVCVPNVPPGLNFWSEESDAPSVCSQATASCVVVYEKSIYGDYEPKVNKECLDDSWAMQANSICAAMGDCGGYVNFVGGYSDDGYEWKIEGAEKKLSQSSVNTIIATGKVIGLDVVNGMR